MATIPPIRSVPTQPSTEETPPPIRRPLTPTPLNADDVYTLLSPDETGTSPFDQWILRVHRVAINHFTAQQAELHQLCSRIVDPNSLEHRAILSLYANDQRFIQLMHLDLFRMILDMRRVAVTLLEQDPEEDLPELFASAATHGDLALVQALASAHSDLDPDGAFQAASAHNHRPIMEWLLEESRLISSQGMDRGLVWSAYKHHNDTFLWLLNRTTDPTVSIIGKEQTLMQASRAGNLQAVELLLENTEFSEDAINNALEAAQETDHAAIVELLRKDLL